MSASRLSPLRPGVAALVLVVVVAACSDRTPGTPPPPNAAPPANTAAPPVSSPAAGGGTAAAEGPTTTSPAANGSAASVAAADRAFLTAAASSGLMEVEASRLALERSKHERVRAFAQRMVDDHTKSNDMLRSVAASVGMNDLPATMTDAHQGHLEKLRSLQGQEFDREYAAQVGVAGHTEAVALFDRATRDGAHQDIKVYAEKSLPTLREHLQQAQDTAKAVGVPADRMKSAAAPAEGAAGSATAGGAPAPAAGAGSATTMGASGTPGKATTTGGGTSGTAEGTAPAKK